MDKQILALLNKQIGIELESSLAYLGMATWAEVHNYSGSAHFLYEQAEEEKEHMMRVVRYLTEVGNQPIIPRTEPEAPSYSSLQILFQKALQMEQKATQAIHSIADLALHKKDFTTFSFLQWFIEEQREEEATARQVNDFFHLIGTQEKLNIYTIDQEIRNLREKKNENA